MADSKLTALTETTSPAVTDDVYIVTTPGGTPASKRCTIANLKAAMLSTGAAGAVLAMGNSAIIWNAGTAFPASKATGDRYWRTDLGMEFYWDGAQWVSVQIYHETFDGIPDNSGDISQLPIARTNDVLGRSPLWSPTYTTLWVGAYFLYRVQTTNNGSNYWALTIDDNGATSITTNSSAGAINTNYNVYVTSGAVVAANTFARWYATKTGTPGSLFFMSAALVYRIIAT